MPDFSNLPDKALSIRQPWAWAILHAGKDIENRSWATKFRGPVCIHTSLFIPQQEDVDDFNEVLFRAWPQEADRERILKFGDEARAMPRGGIIGVAEIIDCVEASESPWFMGSYGFVLRGVQAVPFIPVKGALQFFDWRKKLGEPIL